MKEGDRVTGVPANEVARKEHPTVTGYYEVSNIEWLGEHYKIEYVRVGNISVDCDNIRPAHRREKDTVFSDE